MLLDVSRVLSGDVTLEECVLPIADLDADYFADSAVELQLPIEANCRAKNSAGIVSLEISAPVRYHTQCARCLRDLDITLPLELKEIMVGKLNEADNYELLEVPDGKADVTELIFEGLCFELPLRELCSDDCKGLCSACGANKNEVQCECTTKEIDPRLAVFGKLLEDYKEDNKE